MSCQKCGSKLSGKQKKFCSKRCKTSHNTREWQTNNAYKRKLDFILVRGGKCERCSYAKNIAALTFHHLDPSKKEYGLDMRKLSNTSFEKLKEEMVKCILLCHNCHMEEHYPHLAIGSLVSTVAH